MEKSDGSRDSHYSKVSQLISLDVEIVVVVSESVPIINT